MRSRARAVTLSLGVIAAVVLAVDPATSGCVFRSADDCMLTLGYGCPPTGTGTGTGSGGTGTGAGGAGAGPVTSSSGSGGTAPECTAGDLSKCPDVPPGPCASLGAKACKSGKCAVVYIAGDAPSQQYGSCKRKQCDAKGVATDVVDGTNIYDDGNECTKESCNAGVPVETDQVGMACGAGGFCEKDPNNPGLVTCQECDPTGAPTCLGGAICVKGKCVPQHCTNGTKDQGETDIDCGASSGCLKCTDPNHNTCLSGLDCPSGVCTTASKCAAATCMDGHPNQDETDTDCGGLTCLNRCDAGQRCIQGSDCKSGVCKPSSMMGMPNTCQPPTCTDGVQNGDEEGVDCGGPVSLCAPCAPSP